MQAKNLTEKFIDFINYGEDLVQKYFDEPARIASDVIHYRLQTSIVPVESNFQWMISRTLSRGAQKAARTTQQMFHFLYNVTEVLAKQPVNLIRKPISFVSNFIKAAAIGSLVVRGKNDIYNKEDLKETGKEMLYNIRDGVMAVGIMATEELTLGATPVFLASMGMTAGGAATIGVANSLQASGAALASAALHNPISNMAMNIETVGKGAYLGIEHYFTTPETMDYIARKNGRKEEMEKLINLEKEFKDASMSIEERRAAHYEYNKSREELAIDALGSSRFGRAVLAINNLVTYLPRKTGLMEDKPAMPRESLRPIKESSKRSNNFSPSKVPNIVDDQGRAI